MSETLTGALERAAAEPKHRTVIDLLQRSKPELDKLLPAGVTADRFERIVRTELRRTPLLMECDPWSLLGAVMHSAQLGLEPGPLGLIYLIPYKREVTLVVGYRGYIELAYRSGLVRDVSAHLVRAGDEFKYQLGTSPRVSHVPAGAPGDRDVTAAYAVARLKSGGTVFVVTYDDDWERARKASTLGSRNQGPWVEHRDAMIRKTAVRRLEPFLPKTAELGLAVQVDEQPSARLDDMLAEDETGLPALPAVDGDE